MSIAPAPTRGISFHIWTAGTPSAELLLRNAKSGEARLSDCLIRSAKDFLSLEPEPFLTGCFA